MNNIRKLNKYRTTIEAEGNSVLELVKAKSKFYTNDKAFGELAVLSGYVIEDIDKTYLQLFSSEDKWNVCEVY